jgi:hypothetical protein
MVLFFNGERKKFIELDNGGVVRFVEMYDKDGKLNII